MEFLEFIIPKVDCAVVELLSVMTALQKELSKLLVHCMFSTLPELRKEILHSSQKWTDTGHAGVSYEIISWQ